MNLTSNSGIGVSSLVALSALFVVSSGGCSDSGPTYILIQDGGASGMVGSGGNTQSGGASSGGASSGGTDPGSGGTPPGSGGTDPGSGGTPPGSGGTDPGSGGTDPGSGGTDPGSGGTDPGSGGSAGVPNTPVTLIDDFADCDGNIIEIDGRKGAWYNLNSALSNTFSTGPAPGGWNDPSCGVFLVGNCPACEVAGVAAILAAGSYNLSVYQGFYVTFESEANLYVAVKNTNGQAYGYARSGAVTATGTGGVRTVTFASLTADAQFSTNNGFATAQEIHFTLDDYSKSYGFGLGIHRVELF